MFFRITVMMFAFATIILSPTSTVAEYLDQVPDTEACQVMKRDIDPNMESKQNRDDIEFLYKGTMRQGRQGEQCNIYRRDRSRLRSDSSLNAVGSGRYGRERIFAWGRLCLLDWCDMSGKNTQPQIEPTRPQEEQVKPPQGSIPNHIQPRRDPPIKNLPPPATERFVLRLCNNTGVSPIFLAITKPPIEKGGDYTREGWWALKAGECKEWTGTVPRGQTETIAYHAYAENRQWPERGDLTLCVNKKSEFREKVTVCKQPPEVSVPFKIIRVKGGQNIYHIQ